MPSVPGPNNGGSIFKKVANSFNGRLTYAVAIIALSQVNFGLEQGVFNNTQAMTPFTERFGVYNPKIKA
jgi:SP family sugar:H+ symporter-like MFS transporter